MTHLTHELLWFIYFVCSTLTRSKSESSFLSRITLCAFCYNIDRLIVVFCLFFFCCGFSQQMFMQMCTDWTLCRMNKIHKWLIEFCMRCRSRLYSSFNRLKFNLWLEIGDFEGKIKSGSCRGTKNQNRKQTCLKARVSSTHTWRYSVR